MSLAAELERLTELHRRGVLSDAEFDRAKQLVLDDWPKSSGMDAQRVLNQLRRSTTDAPWGGVCGGLGETTGLPPWLWRALFVVLTLFFGLGAVLYLSLWALIPLDAGRLAESGEPTEGG